MKVSVPNDFSAITLKKYLEYTNDLEIYQDDEDAHIGVAFYHLCGINPSIIKDMDVSSYTAIKEKLLGFLSNWDLPFKQFIDIGGVQYGFEPNLAEMSYGAYLDISSAGELKIDDKWCKIMSILYRPVIKKSGLVYQIEPYTGKDNSLLFLDVTMDYHIGALTFFLGISQDLVKDTLNSFLTITNQ